ncbi:hypothetical protein [Pseudomonas arsenicoxydans]|uniref:hypothetical protein n=1 Tax=Pseudomonas arsenicoxydans TaxID=702115 RepID=UPI0013757CA6
MTMPGVVIERKSDDLTAMVYAFSRKVRKTVRRGQVQISRPTVFGQIIPSRALESRRQLSGLIYGLFVDAAAGVEVVIRCDQAEIIGQSVLFVRTEHRLNTPFLLKTGHGLEKAAFT